jgi:ribosomal protein S18 acetylase RimI-like enzyme
VDGHGAVAWERLDAASAAKLRLDWRSRFEADELAGLLGADEAWGSWEPVSGEFVVARPWRHRREIALLVEIAAIRHADALILDLATRCRDEGCVLLMSMELHERRRAASWQRAGLAPLEDVVTYELTAPSPVVEGQAGISFEIVSAGDATRLAMLLALDHAAFPWIWWNSDEEFVGYLAAQSVSVAIGTVDGEPVCYVGLTRYDNATHLDRIAVRPDRQGAGLGRAALSWAIERARPSRATPMGLSTQRTNARSRALYESVGFRRRPGDDYRLYGRWLASRESIPAWAWVS